LPGANLPATPAGFAAQEIILIKWNIDNTTDPPGISLDPTRSRRYTSIYLADNGYPTDVFSFAQIAAPDDFSTATLPGEDLLKPPAPPDNAMQPGEFVVAYPCYVVFWLVQADGSWQFARQKKAMTTAQPQGSSPKYTGLLHVMPGNNQPQPRVGGNSGCIVAYFACAINPAGVVTDDQYNLFFEYTPAGSVNPTTYYWDPRIKNDGTTGFISGRMRGRKKLATSGRRRTAPAAKA
jgi:hypothetical protein